MVVIGKTMGLECRKTKGWFKIDSVEVIPLRDFQQGIIPSVYAIIYRLYSQSFFLLYRFFATNGIFRTWEAYLTLGTAIFRHRTTH